MTNKLKLKQWTTLLTKENDNDLIAAIPGTFLSWFGTDRENMEYHVLQDVLIEIEGKLSTPFSTSFDCSITENCILSVFFDTHFPIN